MIAACDEKIFYAKMSSTALFTPDYSHLTGFLSHLTSDELKDILNNEEKCESMIKDLKQIKDIEAEREMLVASNKSISEYNLSKKSILEEQQAQVKETYQLAMDLKDSLYEKKAILEKSKSTQSNETLLALLQASTAEAEEEAEATIEAFLREDLSVDNFISTYIGQRTLAHLRRIKAEKMAGLLRDQGTSLAQTPPIRPQRLRKPPPIPTTNQPYYPAPAFPANQPYRPPVHPLTNYFNQPRPQNQPFAYAYPPTAYPQYPAAQNVYYPNYK